MVILNLHGIGPITRKIDDGEKDCWIETDFLRRILDLISDRPGIQLTVDDGNASDRTILLPELLDRGLNCAFFICSDRLGKPTFITKSELQEIHGSSMPIGTHGKIHFPWRKLPPERLIEEIDESRQSLESATGSKIDTAACPFGAYDRATLSHLKQRGFRKVYTSDTGHCGPEDWLVRRNTIKRGMSIDDVRRLIENRPPLIERTKLGLKTFLKRIR